MLGTIATVWAYFLQGRLEVTIAVGTSVVAISILASISGSALPLIISHWSLVKNKVQMTNFYRIIRAEKAPKFIYGG